MIDMKWLSLEMKGLGFSGGRSSSCSAIFDDDTRVSRSFMQSSSRSMVCYCVIILSLKPSVSPSPFSHIIGRGSTALSSIG